jgi:prephenate dehydratase
MEGHLKDERVNNALEQVKEVTLAMKVLGSYPVTVRTDS